MMQKVASSTMTLVNRIRSDRCIRPGFFVLLAAICMRDRVRGDEQLFAGRARRAGFPHRSAARSGNKGQRRQNNGP